VLAVVGVVAYRNTMQISESERFVVETNRHVAHTHEVMTQIALVRSLLEEAETGQRGFLLTGEDSYLEPYQAARDDIGPALEHLKELTHRNANQQRRLRDLE